MDTQVHPLIGFLYISAKTNVPPYMYVFELPLLVFNFMVLYWYSRIHYSLKDKEALIPRLGGVRTLFSPTYIVYGNTKKKQSVFKWSQVRT